MIRVAINGFGRIGRNILRALYERNLQTKIQVVAINDLGSPEINAHLLQFDTTYGRFGFHVEHIDNGLTIDAVNVSKRSLFGTQQTYPGIGSMLTLCTNAPGYLHQKMQALPTSRLAPRKSSSVRPQRMSTQPLSMV